MPKPKAARTILLGGTTTLSDPRALATTVAASASSKAGPSRAFTRAARSNTSTSAAAGVTAPAVDAQFEPDPALADMVFEPAEIQRFLDSLHAEDVGTVAAQPQLAQLPPYGISYTDLLTTPWDGFDIFGPALDADYVAPAPAADLGGMGHAAPRDFDVGSLMRARLGT